MSTTGSKIQQINFAVYDYYTFCEDPSDTSIFTQLHTAFEVSGMHRNHRYVFAVEKGTQQ